MQVFFRRLCHKPFFRHGFIRLDPSSWNIPKNPDLDHILSWESPCFHMFHVTIRLPVGWFSCLFWILGSLRHHDSGVSFSFLGVVKFSEIPSDLDLPTRMRHRHFPIKRVPFLRAIFSSEVIPRNQKMSRLRIGLHPTAAFLVCIFVRYFAPPVAGLKRGTFCAYNPTWTRRRVPQKKYY